MAWRRACLETTWLWAKTTIIVIITIISIITIIEAVAVAIAGNIIIISMDIVIRSTRAIVIILVRTITSMLDDLGALFVILIGMRTLKRMLVRVLSLSNIPSPHASISSSESTSASLS